MTTKSSNVAKGLGVRGLVCVLWLCITLPASAFDCGKYSLKANETNPPWADYIFDGKVKAARIVEIDGEPVVTAIVFEVTKLYKGAKKKEVAVSTAPYGMVDSSGYPFLCGATYHVNAVNKEWSGAYKKLSGLYTDQCMHVRPLSPNALDVSEIERILLDVPSHSAEKEKDRLWNRIYCVPTKNKQGVSSQKKRRASDATSK
ncbi:MAG TPA: hypothetical protein VIU93_13990 [Gallionellaceae bacterium]